MDTEENGYFLTTYTERVYVRTFPKLWKQERRNDWFKRNWEKARKRGSKQNGEDEDSIILTCGKSSRKE